MALFAKSKRVDPVCHAERAFGEARDAQAKLAARLSAAQATVADWRNAAEQAALAGSPVLPCRSSLDWLSRFFAGSH